jgi:hypothetical protein
MRRIRLGKDISVRWKILVNGLETKITGFDLSIELEDAYGIKTDITDFTVTDGFYIEFMLYADQLKNLGKYILTLWLNKGKTGQSVLDHRFVFDLVKYTDLENDDIDDNLEITENMNLTGNLESISTSGQVIGDYVKRDEMENILAGYVENSEISTFLKPEDVSNFLTDADLSLD